MKSNLASLPMAGFIAARNNQEKDLKKTPDADEHMQMASEHQSAARASIYARDHSAASDHLKKAAFHNEKAPPQLAIRQADAEVGRGRFEFG